MAITYSTTEQQPVLIGEQAYRVGFRGAKVAFVDQSKPAGWRRIWTPAKGKKGAAKMPEPHTISAQAIECARRIRR